MDKDIVQIITRNSKPLSPRPTGLEARLRRLPGLKAVVFDVYGTLFISESGDRSELDSDDFSLFSRVLRDAGLVIASGQAPGRAAKLFLEEIDASHGRDRAAGIPFPEVDIRRIWLRVLHTLADEGLISCRVDEAVAESCAVLYESISNPVFPMPGIKDVLRGTVSRGLLLGIVSNAQFYTPCLFPAFLDAPLSDWGFKQELCVWSYELGRAKPDVYLYTKLTSRLAEYSIEPEETLYIGNDMLKDIYPATHEGYKTGLFAGDSRSLRLREKELYSKNVKSDILLTELVQVLDVIP